MPADTHSPASAGPGTHAATPAKTAVPQPYSRFALIALICAGLVLCYLITAPFIAALVWAFTLAVLFAPVEGVLRARFPIPGLTVSVTMMLAAILVVAPVIFVSAALIDAVAGSAGAMAGLRSADDLPRLARDYPAIAPALAWIEGFADFPLIFQSLGERLEQWGASLVLGSITGTITLLLTFYFLFYMLRDRVRIVQAIGDIMPLDAVQFGALVQDLKKTVFASVYGTAAVSAFQGLLGGLVFWWLGLPSPVFWGVVMGLLGIVPFLGAFIVWVPVAIVLMLDGQWSAALILIGWGTFVVGLIDNIVYPVLVGRQLALHSAVTFIAIVGGIIVFGAHGFVLGPLVVAAVLSLAASLRRS